MKERNSNIELLRIVSMVLIVMFHFADGIFNTGTSVEYIRWYSGPICNRVFTVLFSGGGDVGVGVFFLITGYFLSARKDSKLPLKLIYQVLFYSVLNAIAYIIIRFLFNDTSIGLFEAIKKILLPISNSTWWFATVYLLLILICPTINKYIASMDERKHIYIIAVFWVYWYSIGKIFDVYYYRLIQGVFFYIVGAYFAKFQNRNNALRGLIVFIIMWIMYAVCTYLIGTMVVKGNASGILYNAIKLIRRCVLGPFGAIGLFSCFLGFKQYKSGIINRIAETTFGVYLFHAAPFTLKLLWDHVFIIGERPYDELWFPGYMIGVLFLIFVFVFILDTLLKKCRVFV